MSTDFETVDFWRDKSVVVDPYSYFDYLRAKNPVTREPHQDVVMVTGYEEARAVYQNTAVFSSATSVTGPFPGFPVPLEGDDVSEIIEAHRDELPMSDQLPTFDPPKHTAHRGLLMRLLTPKRLKENEEFMWKLADGLIDEFADQGSCEFVRKFASPFAMLVIADLLGVPEEDRDSFREALTPEATGGIGSADHEMAHSPLGWLYDRFSTYIEDRRREPRADVLTGVANATFPDGSTPEVIDAVRVASNLFAAGQETTVRLIAAQVQILCERPELQDLLRDDNELIPNFVEETLRLESPVKGDFRLSRVPTTIGQVDIPAGTTVMVVNGAANRDPRRFENPAEFQLDRPNARQHVSFGHGIHVCPGGPLARTEARVSTLRLLDRLRNIRLSEERHGPPGARRFSYAPTFILRGHNYLHITFDQR
jgi:cytochrome P450 family 150 subfamily A5